MKPRRNIVSVRINDDERAVLERMKLEMSKSVSEIVREAMQPALRQFIINRRAQRRAASLAARR